MEAYGRVLCKENENYVNLAREFAAAYFSEDSIKRWYQEGGIPDSVMWKYKDSGLGYMGLSEGYGGPNIPFVVQMAVLEELSRLAATTLPLQSQALSFNIISKIANREQVEFIVKLFEETARPCFSTAITDAEAGSDIKSYRTEVRKVDGKLILNGQKVYVSNGMFAPYILVVLRNLIDCEDSGSAPFSIWMLPKDSKGVSVYPITKIGQNLSPTSAITFDNVVLDEAWHLGNKSLARDQINLVMDLGRCVVCSNSLGLAQAALDDAARFANSHFIRGKAIGSFQQIGQMLVEMQTEVFNMRAHTYYAAECLESNTDSSLPISIMKSYVPKAGVRVTDAAMQIFGGAGYSDVSRVSRLWLDSRGNQYATGTDQIMNNIASKKILEMYARQQEQEDSPATDSDVQANKHNTTT